MKPRLSETEYNEVTGKLIEMRELYRETFKIMTGRFPKNGQAIRKLLTLGNVIDALYYQTEEEFFRDYPEKELRDFGK